MKNTLTNIKSTDIRFTLNILFIRFYYNLTFIACIKLYFKIMQGIIKFFNLEKGFGFATPEDGTQDAFLHITQCPIVGIDQRGRKNYRIPREGERISYELITNEVGKTEAANIVFIDQDDNGDDSDMD